MRLQQSNADTDREEHSVASALLPRPGQFARAFFRCVLFASISLFAAFPIAVIGGGERVISAAMSLAALLLIPNFILSCAFFRTDRRLALVGFGVLLLLILLLCAIPMYAS